MFMTAYNSAKCVYNYTKDVYTLAHGIGFGLVPVVSTCEWICQ